MVGGIITDDGIFTDTEKLREEILGVESHNALVKGNIASYLRDGGGGWGISFQDLTSQLMIRRTDAAIAEVIPGQTHTVQTPSGPVTTNVMDIISTPSGPQQVWVGSHGVTQQDSLDSSFKCNV